MDCVGRLLTACDVVAGTSVLADAVEDVVAAVSVVVVVVVVIAAAACLSSSSAVVCFVFECLLKLDVVPP